MLHAYRSRDRENGFTLIELMVVVLIIAILIAIAVPTFLGARERAQDKAAQSDLRNSLTAAKVLYTDSQDYSAMTAAELAGVEPSLSFAAVGSATTSVVGFDSTAPASVVFVKESSSGTFFCLADDVTGPGTTFGSGAAIADVDTVGECTGGW